MRKSESKGEDVQDNHRLKIGVIMWCHVVMCFSNNTHHFLELVHVIHNTDWIRDTLQVGRRTHFLQVLILTQLGVPPPLSVSDQVVPDAVRNRQHTRFHTQSGRIQTTSARDRTLNHCDDRQLHSLEECTTENRFEQNV